MLWSTWPASATGAGSAAMAAGADKSPAITAIPPVNETSLFRFMRFPDSCNMHVVTAHARTDTFRRGLLEIRM
ncbi:hypothetical protein MTP06_23840 [Streptomyces sp. PLM4]|uniref:Uncharacterized protein n=1 Tax=Streptomyces albidoflavus TaxID=1886 RepID=A0AA37BZN0_9ACTN|nr:hypothetical protein MTP06_23840 [Streptomyces sp. PLM4]GHI47790.1 hypothetical protein ScoT_39640 [Streptomyces albidoflavus]